MTTPIRIFGAGVRGDVIADLLAWHFADRYALDGFYDDGKPAGTRGPGGALVVGTVAQGLAELPGSGVAAFMAMGTYRSWRNCEVIAELARDRVELPSLISPAAHISPSAQIGPGAFIMAGVTIASHVRIGCLFAANGGVSVEHHSRIGDNVLFGPGVSLAGSVEIGSHSFLGTNTAVTPTIKIGVGTIVGAGSSVVRDLPPGVVAFGAPARPHRAVGDQDEVPSPARVAHLKQVLADIDARS
jgi:sugar O-acyltransferase (sialic acid O-acetyltransferase NeuD family)